MTDWQKKVLNEHIKNAAKEMKCDVNELEGSIDKFGAIHIRRKKDAVSVET